MSDDIFTSAEEVLDWTKLQPGTGFKDDDREERIPFVAMPGSDGFLLSVSDARLMGNALIACADRAEQMNAVGEWLDISDLPEDEVTKLIVDFAERSKKADENEAMMKAFSGGMFPRFNL